MATKKKKKTTKKKQGVMEREIFRIMEACMKDAINAALNEIFKE